MNSTQKKSRRCLVTGASRGIGLAIVDDLAAAGHQIGLSARTESDLQELSARLTVPNLVLPADATDPDSAQRLVDSVVEAWGGIDVLVINAGEGASAIIEETDDEMWAKQLEINLSAPFRLIRSAVPVMKAAGFGRIVVVASVASKAGSPFISAYTAAKHGVLGVVRSAAAELATTGITVNAVAPGPIATAMTSNLPQTLKDLIPMGRMGQPDDVADAVAYLAGDSAGWVTGEVLDVNGGLWTD